ncbi:MAG: acyl carrier protein [Candidatus Omnitrophota bacterium]|nr:acyl carrier protein [Candidatus Omnitrophota bacterium]
MSLFEEIQTIICEQLRLKPEEVKPETSFIDDLGAESIDTIELVMALEEKFNIEIPDEDAERLDTVANVVKYIARKIDRDPEIAE